MMAASWMSEAKWDTGPPECNQSMSPRCPRTTVNSQRPPSAVTCGHEAWAAFKPVSNAP
jgi:hypothetical protein